MDSRVSSSEMAPPSFETFTKEREKKLEMLRALKNSILASPQTGQILPIEWWNGGGVGASFAPLDAGVTKDWITPTTTKVVSALGGRLEKRDATHLDDLASSSKKVKTTIPDGKTWREIFLKHILDLERLQRNPDSRFSIFLHTRALVNELSLFYGISEKDQDDESAVGRSIVAKVSRLKDVELVESKELGNFSSLSGPGRNIETHLRELIQTSTCYLGLEKAIKQVREQRSAKREQRISSLNRLMDIQKGNFNLLMREFKTRLSWCEKIEHIETIIKFLEPHRFNFHKAFKDCYRELLIQYKIRQCINFFDGLLKGQGPLTIDQVLSSIEDIYQYLERDLIRAIGKESASRVIQEELEAIEKSQNKRLSQIISTQQVLARRNKPMEESEASLFDFGMSGFELSNFQTFEEPQPPYSLSSEWLDAWGFNPTS
jgi:hypothetical protein